VFDRAADVQQPEMPTLAHLEKFLSAFDLDALVERIAAEAGDDPADTRGRLEIYLNETRVALGIVSNHVRPTARILEVGSGTGVFALFLRSLGYDITALEPAGLGFDFMDVAREAILDARRDIELPVLRCGIEELEPVTHGTFDLVFSVNVLEHLPDLGTALDNIVLLTADGGYSIHQCPNYTIPFEPHFGVPLLPFVSKDTAARALPRSVSDSELWRSLNFVTARIISTFAERHRLSVVFRQGLMAETLERSRADPVFAERHSLIAKSAGPILKLLGRPIRSLPPRWATPMVFTLAQLGQPLVQP